MPDTSTVTAWLYAHFWPWARDEPHLRAYGRTTNQKDVSGKKRKVGVNVSVLLCMKLFGEMIEKQTA
jgi:hypothetical protein